MKTCLGVYFFPGHSVDRFKYLGNIITNDLKDAEDIDRELRCLYRPNSCNSLYLVISFAHGMSS